MQFCQEMRLLGALAGSFITQITIFIPKIRGRIIYDATAEIKSQVGQNTVHYL